MGYKTPALKGITWMGFLRASTRLIAFVRLAVLARILSPAQFGAFGVATLVLSFLEVITETGINVFLIQNKEKSNDYISSAWIVSIVRGSLIALLLVLFAPLISSFFNSPESYNILLLIAPVPFIRGFINPSIINIQKNIEFHKEFYLRSILLLVDASVAIIAAFVTKSAVSMAYGLIVSAVIEVVLSFILFKPWPKLTFEKDKMLHIFSRGWSVTLTGIFLYLSENLDNITVGRILGVGSLGIYQNAYKISTLTISEIAEVVNKVTFPVYSKFSDDKQRLSNAFKKVISSSSLVAIALGIFIFIFADLIVRIILGPDWASAVPIVKILSVYGVLRTIFGNVPPLLLSLGKQKYVAGIVFVRLFVLAIVIVPLVSRFGMEGAAYAMVISVFAEIPLMIFSARRVLK